MASLSDLLAIYAPSAPAGFTLGQISTARAQATGEAGVQRERIGRNLNQYDMPDVTRQWQTADKSRGLDVAENAWARQTADKSRGLDLAENARAQQSAGRNFGWSMADLVGSQAARGAYNSSATTGKETRLNELYQDQLAGIAAQNDRSGFAYEAQVAGLQNQDARSNLAHQDLTSALNIQMGRTWAGANDAYADVELELARQQASLAASGLLATTGLAAGTIAPGFSFN